MYSSFNGIPVIDYDPLVNGNFTARQEIAKETYQACQTVGFFYLKNVDIPDILINQIFSAAKAFFRLPLNTKFQLSSAMTISQELNSVYLGFAQEKFDPSKPGDPKESLDIFYRKCFMEELFPQNKKVNLTELWPESQKIFQTEVKAFYDACNSVSSRILSAFAISLGLPEHFFSPFHDRNHVLRFLHYPFLEPTKSGQILAAEHSDFVSITLFFQKDVGGLELCTPRGQWVTAQPFTGSILVNVGDLIQRWTNNEFRSIRHRVVVPPGPLIEQSRYSVAFFYAPDNNTEISCIKRNHSSETQSDYPPILAGDYIISNLRESFQ